MNMNPAKLCETLFNQLQKALTARASTAPTVQADYDALVKLLDAAASRYYVGQETGIDDYDYDRYVTLLREVEGAGVVTVNKKSPGATVKGEGTSDTIKHAVPMLSLGDVFSHEQLCDWYKTQIDNTFIVEPKIDGLSIELWYSKGKLVRAATRGNGQTGEDVTEKALRIKSIPNQLIDSDADVVVRGEVYMSKASFAKYREEDPTAKNERNSAVGLLKRKDGGDGAYLFLDCQVFNIQMGTPAKVDTHHKSLVWMQSVGFHVVEHFHICSDLPEILQAIDYIEKNRDEFTFRIDGAVVKTNNFVLRERQGDNGAIPRWAIAYKYKALETTTRLLDVQYQLGKTGKITPVAILDPVDLDGSTISRCTLHNKGRMEALGIQLNDLVHIHKAGDIIPKITSVEHTPQSVPIEFPTTCPVCGEPLQGDTCVNDTCQSKIENKLYFWVDKGGLNIKGVAGSLVAQLIEKGVLKTPADYYKLKPADLYLLPKMGPTKIKNVLTAINASKTKTFPEVLVALGIPGLGWAAASKLNSHVHNWDGLLALTEADCINYISASVGGSLYKALQSDYYQNLIRELKEIFKYE